MDTQTLLKHTSRSLYLSVLALPENIRAAFGIAYLLCRYADSIADTPLLPPERRLYWIERYQRMLTHPDAPEQQRLTDEISGSSSNPYEQKLLENLPLCLEEFNRLPAPQKEATLEVARHVCEGMRIDLTSFPTENSGRVQAFQTDGDLENYCHLMGGAPGVFWSTLITQTVPLSLHRAAFWRLGRDIGDALQIVNILRDLPRDLRIGRCYFPQTDLAPLGLHPEDLLQPGASARFEPVKRKWIAWGLKKLESARGYMRALPRAQLRHRAAVAWPVLWTADTLYKVYREPDLLNPAKRVKISRGVIYFTMLCTPFLLWSNAGFTGWLNRKLRKFR